MDADIRELLERLLSEVQRGELEREALIEALEDAHDMGQLTADEFQALMRRVEDPS